MCLGVVACFVFSVSHFVVCLGFLPVSCACCLLCVVCGLLFDCCPVLVVIRYVIVVACCVLCVVFVVC